jgi:hypothetical protein
MSSILRADAALKFAVSLQVPSCGDLAARAASSPFLKGILPVNLAEIDAHIFGGKAACAECLDPADQAVLQFIFHELDFFAPRPEKRQSYFVDVGAGCAGQGQLGGSMIQFLLEYEIPEIGASCTCAARAARGTGYFLPQGKGKPNHLDPSGMPFIPALTFDFIDFDKRIECHLVAPFPADVKKGRSPSRKSGTPAKINISHCRAGQSNTEQYRCRIAAKYGYVPATTPPTVSNHALMFFSSGSLVVNAGISTQLELICKVKFLSLVMSPGPV